MAEIFFPFNSVKGDRKYKAEDWARYFGLFLRNGIFWSDSTQLKVIEDDGLQVVLKAGNMFINGRCYCNTVDKKLQLAAADGLLNRIDRIVIKCDYANRITAAAVKSSEYSAQPLAKPPQRNADAYELAVADIYVAKGVIAITAANITDLRLNTELCGIVTGLVDQADTTKIFNEFMVYLQEFKQTHIANITNWTQEQQALYTQWYQEQQATFKNWYNTTTNGYETQFNTWFAAIVGMLDGDIATNLARRILVLEQKTSVLEETKAQKILMDEKPPSGQAAQGFELFVEAGVFKVRRVV